MGDKPMILIVEDDPEIAELVSMYATRDVMPCAKAGTAEEAAAFIERERPDLVTLDLNLPGMDGFDFLRSIRGKEPPIPVIVVSAREADEDKILALGLGADDFVTKPFSPRVLVARIQARLRRAGDKAAGEAKAGRVRKFGPFEIDAEALEVRRDGVAIPLRKREFDLLAFLAERPGHPFRSEEIYQKVWGAKYGDYATVGVHVQRIRKKLGEDANSPSWLKTSHGFGYYLEAGTER